MPFSSKAQRRFMYAAEARGDVPKGTASRWEKHTTNKNLPEHVKKAGWITKTAAPATKPLPLASIQKAAQKPMPMDSTFNAGMKQTEALSDSLTKASPIIMGKFAPSNLKNQLISAGGQKSLWESFIKTDKYKALPDNRRSTIDSMGTNLSKGRQTLSDIAADKPGSYMNALGLSLNKNKMAAPVNRGLSFISQSDPEMYKKYRDATIAKGGVGWRSDSLPPATDSIPQPKKRWWSSK